MLSPTGPLPRSKPREVSTRILHICVLPPLGLPPATSDSTSSLRSFPSQFRHLLPEEPILLAHGCQCRFSGEAAMVAEGQCCATADGAGGVQALSRKMVIGLVLLLLFLLYFGPCVLRASEVKAFAEIKHLQDVARRAELLEICGRPELDSALALAVTEHDPMALRLDHIFNDLHLQLRDRYCHHLLLKFAAQRPETSGHPKHFGEDLQGSS
mmetsp:Transcript_50825/g.108852  ORF Transcript_50825/g.108852 Transcript_50825/m.108852 type:complete len:212 (+) Transcript_50825:62-697(+)